MADDWLLYTTEAGWGLPSLEPASIQAQAYLHLAGVPLSVQECSLARSAPTGEYCRICVWGVCARHQREREREREVSHAPAHSLSESLGPGLREPRQQHDLNLRARSIVLFSTFLSLSHPQGVTPSLEHRGELVDAPPSSPTAPADAAAAIIEYARAAGADLDAALTPAQRAEAAAWACLGRAALEPASTYSTWCEPASYPVSKAAYGADLPFPLSSLLPRSARRAAERRFAGLPRERVYGDAAAAVAALADRLASSPGPFFFGDRPSSLDALLYAHLAFHRAAPVAAPELRAALEARPRVGAYVDAVAGRLASLGPPPRPGAAGAGEPASSADWAARAEAAQAEWRRAGAAGPRRAGGGGSGAQKRGSAAGGRASTSGGGGSGGGGGLSVRSGNALWLGVVGAIVGAYVLLSGQYVEWRLEDVVEEFEGEEGGE